MQINTARLRLARKVRNFRANRSLSQQQLSQRASCGVSRRTLQRIEQASANPEITYDPKLSTLLKVASALQTDVSALIGQVSRQTVTTD